ncbi:hypothetical protein BDQ17DRAFT_551491 [Cyathus striatus]|nr:hypothetical protein BDQ17DRAFT_551491 [Cyathus striatus]
MPASTCASLENGAFTGERTSASVPLVSSDHVPRYPKKRTLRDSIQAHLQTRSSSGSVRSVPLPARRIPSERGKIPDCKNGASASVPDSHSHLQAKERRAYCDESGDLVRSPPNAHGYSSLSGDVPSLLAHLSNPDPTPRNHSLTVIGRIKRTLTAHLLVQPNLRRWQSFILGQGWG